MLANSKHIIEEASLQSSENGIRLEILRDLENINSLAEKWDTLVKASNCNRAFSSFTWYQKTYVIDQSLQALVILAYRNEDLVGILPLAHHVKYDQLMFPSNLCDYSDMIIKKNDRNVGMMLLNCLMDLEDHYKNILLKCLRSDSNLTNAISSHLQMQKYSSCFSQITRFNCPYIKLPSTIEDFLSSKSKSFRYDIKRKEKKAAQLGYETVLLDPHIFPADDLPRHFLRLHEARLGEKSGLVTIQDVRAFISATFPILFKKGTLLPFALMHENKVMGMHIYMLGPDGLAYWNGGFDPEVSKLSPGTLTFMAAIRHTINMGLTEFDLLRGEEAYKLKWNTNTRILSQFNSQNKTAL
ncbi:MAG: GNAT family N-acetyltransferase [Flavobacteriales bacterium]|nr:GNAT family N-acetyltransferase [Flavobacteriales bacterium]